jgi:hypothetical protein
MKLLIFNTYMNFSCHQFCCFIVVPLFVLDKSRLRIGVYNTHASKFCVKIAQTSKNSNSNASFWIC